MRTVRVAPQIDRATEVPPFLLSQGCAQLQVMVAHVEVGLILLLRFGLAPNGCGAWRFVAMRHMVVTGIGLHIEGCLCGSQELGHPSWMTVCPRKMAENVPAEITHQ